jgi:hypothetical protein
MNVQGCPPVRRRRFVANVHTESLWLLVGVACVGAVSFRALGSAEAAAIAGPANGRSADRASAGSAPPLASPSAMAGSGAVRAARLLGALADGAADAEFAKLIRADGVRELATGAWDGVLDELQAGTLDAEGLHQIRAHAAAEEADAIAAVAGSQQARLERHATRAGAKFGVKRVDAAPDGGRKLSVDLRPSGDGRPVLEVLTSEFPLRAADERSVLEALEAFGPERLEAVRDVVLKYRTTVTLWRAGTEVDPAHLGVVDALLDTLWSGKTPHPRWGDGGMTLAAPKAGDATSLAEHQRHLTMLWRMTLDSFGVGLRTVRGSGTRVGMVIDGSGDVSRRSLGRVTVETPTGAIRRGESGEVGALLEAIGKDDLVRLMQRSHELVLTSTAGTPLRLSVDADGRRTATLSMRDATLPGAGRSPTLDRAMAHLLAE